MSRSHLTFFAFLLLVAPPGWPQARNAEAELQAGLQAFQQEQYQQALQSFRRIIDDEAAQAPEADYWSAMAYMAHGDAGRGRRSPGALPDPLSGASPGRRSPCIRSPGCSSWNATTRTRCRPPTSSSGQSRFPLRAQCLLLDRRIAVLPGTTGGGRAGFRQGAAGLPAELQGGGGQLPAFAAGVQEARGGAAAPLEMEPRGVPAHRGGVPAPGEGLRTGSGRLPAAQPAARSSDRPRPGRWRN